MSTAQAAGVALVGQGNAGHAFHAPLLAATPRLRLVVVASSDAGEVRVDGLDADVVADPLPAINDPRVALVVLASPNDTHVPLARAALDAGEHVVIDKPFTLSLDEARALAALARQRDRLESVFHNPRWDSDFLAVRGTIDAGQMGEVMHLETHIDPFRPQLRDRWRERTCPVAPSD